MRLVRKVFAIAALAGLCVAARCAIEYQLVGFVPAAGTARSVVVEGNLAYVASDEFGLSVVDVSQPGAALAIGGPKQPFVGTRLAKSGNLVVVTSRADGLRVVDVSNPALPAVVGAIEGIIAEDVAFQNGWAYVRVEVPGNPSHVDLAVVDVRTPASPRITQQIFLPGGDEIEIVGTRLYVTTGSELRTFDISSPSSPAARGTLAVSGGARDLAVSGTWAYVGNSTSLRVVDAANVSKPVLAATFSGATTVLDVDGSRLYRISGDTFQVLSVSNPRAPQLLGSGAGFGSSGVDVKNGRAYLASPRVDLADGEGGLYVCDVSLPNAQQLLSRAGAGVGNQDVSSDGTLAIATSRETGLHVVDVSDPNLPERVGGLESLVALGVAQSGAYAYVRVEVPGNPAHVDLVTVDLRNPANPTVVDQYYLPGGDTVEVKGSYLYLTTGTQLRIFSLANPRAPTSVGALSISGARDLAVGQGHVLVGSSTAVSVVEVTDPSRPRVRGSVSGGVTSLAAQGTRGYAVSGSSLRVIDFSSPTAPIVLQTVDALGAADVATSGGEFVLLASPNVGLGMYTVDPNDGTLSPSVQRAVPGSARSVSAGGGVFYVGDTAASVTLFRAAAG